MTHRHSRVRRARNGGVLDIVFVVILMAVVGFGLSLLISSESEAPATVAARRVGATTLQAKDHYLAAHVEHMQGFVHDELRQEYLTWRKLSGLRLSRLQAIAADPNARPPEFRKDFSERLEQEFASIKPRAKVQIGRLLVYLDFALNGVRPLDELKSGAMGAVIDDVGPALNEPYNRIPESGGLVGQNWSFAAGDPPNLEFTAARIGEALRGIDRESSKMSDLLKGDAPKGDSPRLALYSLIDYELKNTGVANGSELTGKLAEIRNRIEALKAELTSFAERDFPSARAITPADAERWDQKAVALDIRLTGLEIKIAETLADAAGLLGTIARAKGERQYELVTETLVRGRSEKVDGVDTLVGGLGGLVGASDVASLLPADSRLSSQPSQADANVSQLVDLGNGKVGHGAAVAVQLMASAALRRATDNDMALAGLRKELVGHLAALEPAKAGLRTALDKYRREAIANLSSQEANSEFALALKESGGLYLAVERVRTTLETNELDAAGNPVMTAEGQPRPGLKAALSAAQEQDNQIKTQLKALYARAEELDAAARDQFGRQSQLAGQLVQLTNEKTEEAGRAGVDLAAMDYTALVGNIRDRANTGGLFGDYERLQRETATKARDIYPAWWDRYTDEIDRAYRRNLGEELPPRGEIPAELPLGGTMRELVSSLVARPAGEVAAELAGYDAEKAAALAGLEKSPRNLVLAYSTGETLDKLLGLMPQDQRERVIAELDLFGVEKLIALREAALIQTPGEAAPAAEVPYKRPTLAEREEALNRAVYYAVPVLKAKLEIAESVREELETLLANRKTSAQEARREIAPASAALKKAVEQLATTSRELLGAEARVARLYDEAIRRYLPAASLAAEKTGRAWYRTTAALEHGNGLLLAGAFYLQQQRRLLVIHQAVEALKALPLEGGFASLVTKPEDRAHFESVSAVVTYMPAATLAPEVLSSVNLLDFKAESPASGPEDLRQPLPLVRLLGLGDANANGQASVILEAIGLLGRAKSVFLIADEKPRLPSNFPPATKAEPVDTLRTREEYLAVVDWPLDVSIGTAAALAHRVTGDRQLTGAWPASLREGLFATKLGTNLAASLNTYSDGAKAYIAQGLLKNLLKNKPEFRSAAAGGLDAANYTNPQTAPVLVLNHIGLADAMDQFAARVMGSSGGSQ